MGQKPAAVKRNVNGFFRVGMNRSPQVFFHLYLSVQFFFDFALQGIFGLLTGIDLTARKFPVSSQMTGSRTLGNEKTSGLIENDGCHDPNTRCLRQITSALCAYRNSSETERF